MSAQSLRSSPLAQMAGKHRTQDCSIFFSILCSSETGGPGRRSFDAPRIDIVGRNLKVVFCVVQLFLNIEERKKKKRRKLFSSLVFYSDESGALLANAVHAWDTRPLSDKIPDCVPQTEGGAPHRTCVTAREVNHLV